MAESSKIFTLFGPGLTQRGLLISGSLALGATVLSFAPVLPQANVWQALDTSPAVQVAPPPPNSTWAGHLEAPGAGGAAASGHALTSASYTTGFDSTDAAPMPANVLKAVAIDPSACPNDLNCTFRSRAGVTLPVPRPRIALIAPVHMHAETQPREGKKATGFAALLPKLPSTHTLLRPFAFVANTFGGLMHKL
jgi:hypothetical protein